MRVLVCVKHVPVEVTACRFDATFVTDRAGLPGHLGAADRAALAAAAALGADEVVAVTMGPAPAWRTLAQARALGATRLVQVTDSALVGSDVAATSLVLAAVAREIEADLVMTGAESDDGGSGFIPAQIASRLSWPLLGRVTEVSVEDAEVRGTRGSASGRETLAAGLPAVVSVLGAATPEPEQVTGGPGEATLWGLRELGIEPGHVGRSNAWTRVETVMPLEAGA